MPRRFPSHCESQRNPDWLLKHPLQVILPPRRTTALWPSSAALSLFCVEAPWESEGEAQLQHLLHFIILNLALDTFSFFPTDWIGIYKCPHRKHHFWRARLLKETCPGQVHSRREGHCGGDTGTLNQEQPAVAHSLWALSGKTMHSPGFSFWYSLGYSTPSSPCDLERVHWGFSVLMETIFI